MIKVAVFGTGFMARVHVDALRRLGDVEVAGISGRTAATAEAFGKTWKIARSSSDIAEFLADKDIAAVHICTPNHLHYEMVMASIRAGKAIICEKPLTSTSNEARELVQLAKDKNILNCTLYNVRGYPQVQAIRELVSQGKLGQIYAIQGTYSQDWLSEVTDWNWRVNSGASRTFADIGTHWCDLVEHITGQRITSLCADLATFHKTRKMPRKAATTFAKASGDAEYDDVAVHTEDFGGMIFRMGDTARGAMTVSQISIGRKNRIVLEIYGAEGSAVWEAERPDELWLADRGAVKLVQRDPSRLSQNVAGYTELPAGHAEGYADTFKNVFRRFYSKLQGDQAQDFPTFQDGLRQIELVEAVLQSSKTQGWVNV